MGRESTPLLAAAEGFAGRNVEPAPTNDGYEPWMVITRQPRRVRKVTIPDKESMKIGGSSLPLTADTVVANKEKAIAKDQQPIPKDREFNVPVDDAKKLNLEGPVKNMGKRRKRKSKGSKPLSGPSDVSTRKVFGPGASKSGLGGGPEKPNGPSLQSEASKPSSSKAPRPLQASSPENPSEPRISGDTGCTVRAKLGFRFSAIVEAKRV
ncbi:hypothetical protein LINPERHAP1_LOCUS36339 [Linum perenne]